MVHVHKPHPGDALVDIAAGRGEDVYAFSRAVGPQGLVWAVEAIPFDALCRRHSITAIDFLKMNIEGAELNALPGCREALKHTRFCSIAAHDFRAARGEGE